MITQLSIFDLQQWDPETSIVVQREDKEFDRNINTGNTGYILGGKNLGRIQDALRYKRPGFVDYLNSKRIPQNTAYKLISIGKMFTESVNISSIEALKILAAPSTPDEARQEAIDRAEQGETITYTSARQIVEDHKNGKEDALEDLYRQTSERQNAPDGILTHIKQEWAELNPPDFNYKRDNKTNREGDIYTPQGYDVCQTPAYAIDPLLSYLNPAWTIWEPAAGEGNLVEAFYDSKIKVTDSDLLTGENFFEYEPARWDCIVTNPPYSIKYEWIERCYQLGKPFALLVPLETMGAQRAQILTKRYGVELMFLNRRVNFKMPNKGWSGAGAQFPVIWLCWQLLPNPIIYGEIVNTDELAG